MSQTMKILIAEDEPFMAALIEKRLLSEGYEIIRTTDGREALKLAEQENPDLIITDILMPFTSGLELIGIIKSSFTKKIPIIVFSIINAKNKSEFFSCQVSAAKEAF